MLLAIDIGNTNVTLGLWDGHHWIRQWRLRTVRDKTSDEYGIDLTTLLREAAVMGELTDVILSSVVPQLTTTFKEVCQKFLQHTPLIVTADTNTGIRILTENPYEVGADRIVNAVGAHQLYPGAKIIIDTGTATTFDAVSSAGELLGVVIAPGLRVAADALISRAAQLSQVSLTAPPQTLGRNTTHAVQSGLIFGYTALIEGIVQRLRHEMTEKEVTVIGTGGLISLITPHTPIIDHIDPWLTLTGLRLIHERNQTP